MGRELEFSMREITGRGGNNQTHFDYETFVNLQQSDLYAYMEPLLAVDVNLVVQRDVLERVFLELPSYDEYHLVYGLELGGRYCPDLFIGIMPRYLKHPARSVWCAAFRVLDNAPSDSLTPEILNMLGAIKNGE